MCSVNLNHILKIGESCVEGNIHDNVSSQNQVDFRFESKFIQAIVAQKSLKAELLNFLNFLLAKNLDCKWGSLNAMISQMARKNLVTPFSMSLLFKHSVQNAV